MSLASFSAPSAVSTGMAWAPQQAMPQSNIPLRDSSAAGVRGAVGTVQTERSRGDLTGDLCLTLDLFANKPCVSTWDEKTSVCKTQNKRCSLEVNYSAEGQRILNSTKKSKHGVMVQDLCDQTSIGGPGTFERVGGCFPVGGLLDLDFVDGYGEAPVEPISSLPLPMLTALLIDGVIKYQNSPGTEDSSSESKKGKGKGKRSRQLPSLTLVGPAGLNQAQRALLLTASELCGRSVKNIFNRGVAVVAGGLYQASQTAAAGGARSQGKVALAGDLLDVLCGQEPEAGEEPLVLYVHVYALPGGHSGLYYDAVLVRCEGAAGAASVGAPLGFERLCTLAARGGKLEQSEGKHILTELAAIVGLLQQDAAVADQKSIRAVVLDGLIAETVPGKGSVDRSRVWSDADAVSVLASPAQAAGKGGKEVEVVRALASDAATGACVLSAAELSSSKEYLQRTDGEWAIAYLFPVADGSVLGRELGVRVLWGPSEAEQLTADVAVDALFPVGTRLWKEDAGPIPARSAGDAAPDKVVTVNGVFKMEFKNGAAKVSQGRSSTRTVKPPAGWPRVQILERARREAGSPWRTLETLTPLLSCYSAHDSNVDKAEAVQSCVLEVRVETGTGAVSAAQSKGPSVSRAWEVFQERLLLGFVLVLPFLLIGLWYASSYLSEWYSARQQAAWLTEFYRKNAPEKLQDAEYVARTAAKYKDRMFLLWRNLERAYKVKWPAPPGVTEV